PPVSPSFPNTENFYDFIGKTDQVLFVEEICRHLSLERFFTCLQRQPSEKRSLIFLNVHPHIFTKSYYKSDKTLKLLESYGISPENVVFELSERAAIDSYVDMNEILAEYRSQGIRIALDDIGSGYNSLKTLVHLKPEFLKLDKSLIQWIDQDKTKQQMVKLLSEFAKQTNAFLIAEGIERMEELFFLKENDIHIGQGYAIGKPSQQLTNGTLPRIYNKKPM
ncbi:MAG TPA: EAL domain-containing protein, partial [Chondromyces sp.]|nr:EAL domain-containing protein [Chondromyces sp.]